MNNVNLDVYRIVPEAILPSRASAKAANYDLYSSEDTVIGAGKVELVSTGLRFRVPYGYVFEIYGRSGLAREGIIVANGPGQVDSDYRGEVKVILYNAGSLGYYIKKGDRIAQGRLVRLSRMDTLEVPMISTNETVRGEGGFGHTGR
jgi:dUTP pyrophosphatase